MPYGANSGKTSVIIRPQPLTLSRLIPVLPRLFAFEVEIIMALNIWHVATIAIISLLASQAAAQAGRCAPAARAHHLLLHAVFVRRITLVCAHLKCVPRSVGKQRKVRA